MPNNYTSKVRLNRSDLWRTVLTDTSPFEVPIIVSNDGFYKNLSTLNRKSPEFLKFIDSLILKDRNFTIPLKYNIVKSSNSVRTLSLLHPHGQIDIANFYQKYNQLICEYGKRSPFSIRKPNKIGTTYFIKSSKPDVNKYKNSSVDTNEIDSISKNPASYFSYAGFDRLYKFFLSNDHTRLEKKFRYQLSLDIGKCFDSIYSHSISWAVKNKKLSKNNVQALSFGNQFDGMMQRLNYNETNGICIGPETSRIFAEIILSEVDKIALSRIKKIKIREKFDFECRRYVDNYYIFSNSETELDTIQHELSIALKAYNLHLNEGKTEKLKRPFYTKKSLVVDRVNTSIQDLWIKIVDKNISNGRRYQLPRIIYNHRALFGAFTRQIKAACYASDMGYDATSNYVIGALKRKTIEVLDDYSFIRSLEDANFDNLIYRKFCLFVLDVAFYFFTLHPTVASSLRLSHMIVRVAQHLREHDDEGYEIVKEYALRWTSLVARSPTFAALYQKSSVIPVELLNILVSLQEFSADGTLESDLLDAAKLEVTESNYFQIIVKIFIYKDHPNLASKRDAVFNQACDRLVGDINLAKDAELTHLLLDLLACPFIASSKRIKLLKSVWPHLKQFDGGIGRITNAIAEGIVSEIEQQHWFVRWDGIDLLNMIEKKELSAVYA